MAEQPVVSPEMMKLLAILASEQVTDVQLRRVMDSGFLIDLLHMDYASADRKSFRRAIGWIPFSVVEGDVALDIHAQEPLGVLVERCSFTKVHVDLRTLTDEHEPEHVKYQLIKMRGSHTIDLLQMWLRETNRSFASIRALLAIAAGCIGLVVGSQVSTHIPLIPGSFIDELIVSVRQDSLTGDLFLDSDIAKPVDERGNEDRLYLVRLHADYKPGP